MNKYTTMRRLEGRIYAAYRLIGARQGINERIHRLEAAREKLHKKWKLPPVKWGKRCNNWVPEKGPTITRLLNYPGRADVIKKKIALLAEKGIVLVSSREATVNLKGLFPKIPESMKELIRKDKNL